MVAGSSNAIRAAAAGGVVVVVDVFRCFVSAVEIAERVWGLKGGRAVLFRKWPVQFLTKCCGRCRSPGQSDSRESGLLLVDLTGGRGEGRCPKTGEAGEAATTWCTDHNAPITLKPASSGVRHRGSPGAGRSEAWLEMKGVDSCRQLQEGSQGIKPHSLQWTPSP